MKPFTKDDLYTAIEICLHNSSAAKRKAVDRSSNIFANTSFFIKDGQLFKKLRFADVLYLESEHVYVNVHTPGNVYLVRASLQDYLENFDANNFLRIHRSYAINLEHIQSVHADYVLINGIQLPVGKTYRNEMLKRLNLG